MDEVDVVDKKLKGRAVDVVDEVDGVDKRPTALELLRQAEEALDEKRGKRAKSYGKAAERVREIVAWLESLE